MYKLYSTLMLIFTLELGSIQRGSALSNDCGCGPVDGTNQPECVDFDFNECMNMFDIHGKCKWTLCLKSGGAEGKL